MAHYLMLGHYTDKGINGIQESQERINKFKALCQENGAKVISYYLLMGQFDIACILEASNADIIAKIALIVGKRGNVRTETLCAFTEQEQIQMATNLKL